MVNPSRGVVAGWEGEAGRGIADHVFESGGNLMTVSEHGSYDELVLGGGIRPHGLSENEDLGSLANCPDAYLAKALFSAKECTYKCLYPVMRIPLEFADVELDLDLGSHSVCATLASRAEMLAITLSGPLRSQGR